MVSSDRSWSPAVRAQIALDILEPVPLDAAADIASAITPDEQPSPLPSQKAALSKWLRNLGHAFASGSFKFVRQNATTVIGGAAEYGANYLIAQNLNDEPDLGVGLACTLAVGVGGLALCWRAGQLTQCAVLAGHPDSTDAATAAAIVVTIAPLICLATAMAIYSREGVAPATLFLLSAGTRALDNGVRDFGNEFLPRTPIGAQDVRAGDALADADALRHRSGTSMLFSLLPNTVAAAVGDRILPEALGDLPLPASLGGGSCTRVVADGITKGNYALINEVSRAAGASTDGADGELRFVTNSSAPRRDLCEHLGRAMEDTSMRTALGVLPHALHALADHFARPGEPTHTALKGGAWLASAVSELRGPLVELGRVHESGAGEPLR